MTTDPFRDAFERMAPRPVDPAAARAELGALTPGFQKARRFRRVRLGAASAVCALGLAVGGPAVLAAVGSDSSSAPLDFASQGGSDPDIADAAEVDSRGDDLDTSPDVEESETPDHLSDDGSADSAEDQPVEITDAVDDSGDSSVPSGDSSVPPDDGASAPTAADTDEVTMPSDGGSVTYTLADGVLVLVRYPPMSGFEAEVVKDDGTEIKVRFSDGSVYFEVEIELEDGVITDKATGPHTLDSSGGNSGRGGGDESDEHDEPDTEEG